MPTFRSDLESIPTYSPGKPIDELSRELGITDIAKLASNESPLPPFPEVQEVIADIATGVNRYPENSGYYLVNALAERFGIAPDNFWLGAGSTQLLYCLALAVGGGGTSAVFAKPSFVMYPISARIAGSEPVSVPLDDEWRHDLAAMATAIRDTTTVVYVCNPNNPTGTHLAADEVERFIRAVPERVLIVVDEAYHEYVTAADYASAVPLALGRENVLVTRTFSKVYGLAGLRVGYGIGHPDTLAQLRRTQVPFSTNAVGQAAALEALRHDDRVAERVKENTAGRELIEAGLAERNIEHVSSQTNFIMMRPAGDPAALAQSLLERGVIVRPMGPIIRITVGTADENHRFLDALDAVVAAT